MHCVTLADLAAVLALHGPRFIYRRSEISSEVLVNYWTENRNRFESWHRTIGQYRDIERQGDWSQMTAWWDQERATVDEILVSEMLTRVVAALALGVDQQNALTQRDGGRDDTEPLSPIMHGVFMSHLEASNRVHQMTLARKGCSIRHLVQIDRLRRAVQRWNDVLIGRLAISWPRGSTYCYDLDRARDFGIEYQSMGDSQQQEAATELLNASMRLTLSNRTESRVASPNLNRALATSVMRLFRPESFDSFGYPKSMRTLRIQLDEQTSNRTFSAANTIK